MTGLAAREPQTARVFRVAISRYWAVALVIVGWQLWVTLAGINVIVMPKPLDVLGDVVGSPILYLQNGAETIILAAVGLVLGMAFGTLIAVIAWTSRVASGIVAPLGLVFSSVPVVTLIPVLTRLFGYDIKTVVAIVVVISFLPAFVFTSAGLKALPQGSDDLFKVLGAARRAQLDDRAAARCASRRALGDGRRVPHGHVRLGASVSRRDGRFRQQPRFWHQPRGDARVGRLLRPRIPGRTSRHRTVALAMAPRKVEPASRRNLRDGQSDTPSRSVAECPVAA